MQTLKLSVSLTDPTHPDLELQLCADELICNLVISVPAIDDCDLSATVATSSATPPLEDPRLNSMIAAEKDVVIRLPTTNPSKAPTTNDADADAYALGGYAGI